MSRYRAGGIFLYFPARQMSYELLFVLLSVQHILKVSQRHFTKQDLYSLARNPQIPPPLPH